MAHSRDAIVQAVEEGTRKMEECYRELDRADKEALRTLTDIANRGYREPENTVAVYLAEHKQKTSTLRHTFSESSRSVELGLERMRSSRQDWMGDRREIENDIDRMKSNIVREHKVMLMKLEDGMNLRQQLEREVEVIVQSAAGSTGNGAIRKTELRILDQFRRLAKEGNRMQELVQTFEDGRAEKIDRLLGLIDTFKNATREECTRLHAQIDSMASRERERSRPARENSRDSRNIEQSWKEKSDRPANRANSRSRERPYLTVEEDKGKKGYLSNKNAGVEKSSHDPSMDLLEKVQAAINSVERYREVCPPQGTEGLTVQRRMLQDLDTLQKVANNVSNILLQPIIALSQNNFADQSPAAADSNSLLSTIQGLKRANDKLERKCEDRKVSLKKLYFIVTEKTRQLQEACQALESMKNGSRLLLQTVEETGAYWIDKIESMESRLVAISSFIKNAAPNIGVPVLTKSAVAGFSGAFQGDRPHYRGTGDGSLEYSFTRRYDGLHRSVFDSRFEDKKRPPSDTRGGPRKSQDSTVMVADKHVHLPKLDSGELVQNPNLDDSIHQILHLAREKLHYSEDEDPEDAMVSLVKIAKDWRYLAELIQQETEDKNQALEDKEKLLRGLDERERMHSSIMRDLSQVKYDKTEVIKENERLRSEVTKLSEELSQAKKALQPAAQNQSGHSPSHSASSKSPPRYSPGHQPVPATSPNTTTQGRTPAPTSTLPPLPALTSTPSHITKQLTAENEKLKDKLSLYKMSLTEKKEALEEIINTVHEQRAVLEETRSCFQGEISAMGEEFLVLVRETIFAWEKSRKEKNGNPEVQGEVVDGEALAELQALVELKEKEVEEAVEKVEELEKVCAEAKLKSEQAGLRLAQALGEKDRQAKEIERLKRVIEDSQSRVDEEITHKASELNLINDSLKAMSARVQDLNSTLSKKDKKIGELEANLTRQLDLAQSLEQNLAQKDKKISNMESLVNTLSNKLMIKETGSPFKIVSPFNQSIDPAGTPSDQLERQSSLVIEEITTLKKNLQSIEETCKKLKEENFSLKETIEGLEEAVREKEQELAKFDETIGHLKRSHEEAQEDLQALIEDRDNHILGLKDEIEKNEEATTEYEEQIKMLREKLNKAEAENREHRKEAESKGAKKDAEKILNEQVEELQKQIQRLEKDVDQEKATRTKLESKLSKTEEDLVQAVQSKVTAEGTLEEIKQEFEAFKVQESNTSQSYITLQGTYKQVLANLELATAQIQKLEAKNAEIGLESEELATRLHDEMTKSQEAEKTIETLSKEVETIKQTKPSLPQIPIEEKLKLEEENRKLKVEVEDFRSQVQELKQELKLKSDEVEIGEQEFEALVLEKEEIQTQLKEVTEKFVALAREKSEIEKAVNSQKPSYPSLNSKSNIEIEKLKSSLAESEEKYAALQETNQALEDRLNTLNDELLQHVEISDNLKTSLQILSDQNKELELQNEAEKQLTETLKNIVARIEQDKKVAEDQIKVTSDEKTQLDTLYKSLQQQFIALQGELRKKSGEIAKLQEQVAKESSLNSDSEKRFRTLEVEGSDLKVKLQEKEGELVELLKSKAEVESELKEKEAKLGEKDELLNRLREETAALEQKSKDLMKEKEKLSEQIELLNKQISSDSLKHKLEVDELVNRKQEELAQKLGEVHKRIDSLQEELTCAQRERDRVTQSLSELKERLSQEAQGSEILKQSQEKELSRMKAIIEELTSLKAQNKLQLDSMAEQLSQKQAKLSQVSAKNKEELDAKHESEISNIKKAYDEYTQKLKKQLEEATQIKTKLEEEIQNLKDAQSSEIENLKRAFEGDLESAKEAVHTKELERLQEKLELEMARQKEEFTQRISEINAMHKDEIDAKEASRVQALQEIAKKNQETQEALIASQKATIKKINNDHDQQLEELITRLEKDKQDEVHEIAASHEQKMKKLTAEFEKQKTEIQSKVIDLEEKYKQAHENQKSSEKALETAKLELTKVEAANLEMKNQLEKKIAEGLEKYKTLLQSLEQLKDKHTQEINKLKEDSQTKYSQLVQEYDTKLKKANEENLNERKTTKEANDQKVNLLEEEIKNIKRLAEEKMSAETSKLRKEYEELLNKAKVENDSLKANISVKERDIEEVRQKSVLEKAALDTSAKKEFEKVLQNIRSKDEEIRILSEKITKLEKDNTSLINNNQLLETKVKTLTNTISTRDADIQTQAANFQANLSSKASELASTSSELSQVTSELSAAQNELNNLRSEVDRLHSESNELKIEIASRDSKVASLQESVLAMQQTLDEKERQVSALIKGYEDNLTEVENTYEEELAGARESQDRAWKESEGLRRDLQAKDLDILKIKEDNSELQARVEELLADIERLNVEIKKKVIDSSGVLKAKDQMLAQAEARAQAKEKEANDLSERVARLERKLEASVSEVESRQQNIAELSENLQQMAHDIEQKDNQIKDYEAEVKAMKKNLRDLEVQLKEANERATKNFELSQNKSQYVDKVVKENENYMEEIKQLQQKLAEETETTNIINEKLAETTASVSALMASIDGYKAKIDSQASELKTIEHRLHESESNSAISSTKIATLEENIRSLEKSLEEAHMSYKKTSSTQSESVEILKQALAQERTSKAKEISAMKSAQSNLEASLIREQQARAFDREQQEKELEEVEAKVQQYMEREKAFLERESEWQLREQQWISMAKQTEELHDENEKLHAELDKVKIERDGFKEEHTSALFRGSELENEVAELRIKVEEAASLFDQIEVHKNQLEENTQQILEKNDQIQTLNNELREAHLRIERLTEDLVAVKEARNSSDDIINQTLERATKAENELTTIITERNKERKEKEGLQSNMIALNEKLAASSAREEEQQNRIKDLKNEIKNQSQTLETLQSQHKTLSEVMAQTQASLAIAKQEAESFKNQHQSILEREKAQTEKLRASLTAGDLERSEMGGRVKELLSSIENYRTRYESEAQTTRDLRAQLQAASQAQDGLLEEIKRIKEGALKQKQKRGDAAERWKLVSTKAKQALLLKRVVFLSLILRRYKPQVVKVKKLESENQKLSQDLITQTMKVINIERNRSEIEMQLNQKESQLDQVMILGSKTNINTMKSEADPNQSAREINTGRSNLETRAHALRLALRDVLAVIGDFLQIAVPPIDNLNDKQWDNFIPKLKLKINDMLTGLDDAKTNFETYKKLLEEQMKENNELREKIRSISPPQLDTSLSSISKQKSLENELKKPNSFLDESMRVSVPDIDQEDQAGQKGLGIDFDLRPATDNSEEQDKKRQKRRNYSDREAAEDAVGVIQYDAAMPNTDSERLFLQKELQKEKAKYEDKIADLQKQLNARELEFQKLLTSLQDLRESLATKEEECEDLKVANKEGAMTFANEVTARKELRSAIEMWLEGIGFSSAKGDDAKERMGWDRLMRSLGWNEPKSKETRERLAKGLGKKKGFV